MQEVILMVGYPGSGKSTKANEFSRRGYAVVNQDSQSTVVGRRKAKLKCLNEFEAYVAAGKNVVVDRCNHNKNQRHEFIAIARAINPDIRIRAILMVTSPDKCIQRIKARQNHQTLNVNTHLKKVAQAVSHFYRNKQSPTASEGIDKIQKVYAS